MCGHFVCGVVFFFFKQKTAYEMRISDWSSDVCSSDLYGEAARQAALQCVAAAEADGRVEDSRFWCAVARQLRGTTDGVPTTTAATLPHDATRSEERRVGKERDSTCRCRW